MRRVLARREMRPYVAGQTLSLFGDSAMWLALGVWAKVLTGSSAAAGMVVFFIAAPALLSPLSGLLVDRVRRRRLLIVANLGTAVAVLPLLLVGDRGDIWILYAVAAAYGFSYTVLGSGQSALLATLLPPRRAGRCQRADADRARGAAPRGAAGGRRAVHGVRRGGRRADRRRHLRARRGGDRPHADTRPATGGLGRPRGGGGRPARPSRHGSSAAPARVRWRASA
jgi:hypothetical protein